MKERTKNSLCYCSLLAAALLVGSCILYGDVSQPIEKTSIPFLSEADQDRIDKSLYEHSKLLQQSDKARDIAVSAFLQNAYQSKKNEGSPPSSENIALLKKAISLDPNDPDLAWLEAMDCSQLAAACNKADALLRLKKIEPDNLAVHLLDFNQAVEKQDFFARDNALQAMADSHYSDIHYFSQGYFYYYALRDWNSPVKLKASQLFSDDINQKPVTQDEMRKMVANGYSIATAMPALQSLIEFCKEEGLDNEPLESCQKIARIMVTDKTIIMNRIGLLIGATVFRQNPQASQWRNNYRKSYWLSSQYAQPYKLYSVRNAFGAWPNMDEIAIQKQKLMMQGIPLTPPADWMPESEEVKKLLKAPVATTP